MGNAGKHTEYLVMLPVSATALSKTSYHNCHFTFVYKLLWWHVSFSLGYEPHKGRNCVCVGVAVTFRIPVCSRCSLNTERLNWVGGQVGSASGFTSRDREHQFRGERGEIDLAIGGAAHLTEKSKKIWYEKVFGSRSARRLLLIHLQALWPSLSCLGARSREARSCGGEGKGRIAITNTHSQPPDPTTAKNNVATAESAVSIIRPHEEGKQSQKGSCFSSVSCLVTEGSLFSRIEGLETVAWE